MDTLGEADGRGGIKPWPISDGSSRRPWCVVRQLRCGTPARNEREPGVRLAQAVLALGAYPEVALKDVTFPYA
jgi:hypothetical protein